MSLLLDTHALLWFTLGEAKLSSAARALIEDPTNDKLISPAAYLEIAIKTSIGKLPLSQPLEEFLDRAIGQNGFDVLPIEPKHAVILAALPFHHTDPFDRILIAQALSDGVPIVSIDVILDPYGVTRFW